MIRPDKGHKGVMEKRKAGQNVDLQSFGGGGHSTPPTPLGYGPVITASLARSALDPYMPLNLSTSLKHDPAPPQSTSCMKSYVPAHVSISFIAINEISGVLQEFFDPVNHSLL